MSETLQVETVKPNVRKEIPGKILLAEISQCLGGIERGEAQNRPEWVKSAQTRLHELVKLLPSGSGIDSGCKLDDSSSEDKIIIALSYHHMNDGGFYDGWTAHKAVFTPSFDGFRLRITGRDRNQTKEHLHETLEYCLSRQVIHVVGEDKQITYRLNYGK